MRVFIVVAHPDDEVLGCGATAARHAIEGDEVDFLILGEGVTSRSRTHEDADSAALERLHEATRKAIALLGGRSVVLSGLADNRFDTVPLLDIVQIVEERIRSLCPDVVYTHHGSDLNVDHRLTFQAVLTATRPVGDHRVREVYSFETPSSTEWGFHRFDPVFRPNRFVDVAATFERKLEAMRAYASEMRPFPHPRSAEALRSIAVRWGSVAGCPAAEAFELVRSFS